MARLFASLDNLLYDFANGRALSDRQTARGRWNRTRGAARVPHYYSSKMVLQMNTHPRLQDPPTTSPPVITYMHSPKSPSAQMRPTRSARLYQIVATGYYARCVASCLGLHRQKLAHSLPPFLLTKTLKDRNLPQHRHLQTEPISFAGTRLHSRAHELVESFRTLPL